MISAVSLLGCLVKLQSEFDEKLLSLLREIFPPVSQFMLESDDGSDRLLAAVAVKADSTVYSVGVRTVQ